jgi:four helix bundle protein
MKITRFEDIEAWKAARKLVKELYRATESVVRNDRDLARQMRRAAMSAPANIAEGFDAGTDLEFRRFLRMARRSLSELQSHLYIALDLEFLGDKAFRSLYDQAAEVKRIIGGFLRYLGKGRE